MWTEAEAGGGTRTNLVGVVLTAVYVRRFFLAVTIETSATRPWKKAFCRLIYGEIEIARLLKPAKLKPCKMNTH